MARNNLFLEERHANDGPAGPNSQRGRTESGLLEMTQDEVKAVIHEVLMEQKEDHDQVVLKTISAILTSFGIDDDDRKEIRADFTHLRKWRKSVEQAQSYTFKAMITIIATGIMGALWMGIKAALGK